MNIHFKFKDNFVFNLSGNVSTQTIETVSTQTIQAVSFCRNSLQNQLQYSLPLSVPLGRESPFSFLSSLVSLLSSLDSFLSSLDSLIRTSPSVFTSSLPVVSCFVMLFLVNVPVPSPDELSLTESLLLDDFCKGRK